MALRAVGGRRATSPSRPAQLGEATAEVHRTLAEVLRHRADHARAWPRRSSPRCAPATWPPSPRCPRWRATSTRDRRRAATRPSTRTGLPLQRIHGDYHLGQVLHSAERGWVLLDFEGEPLRPLSERSLPDQWVRDVAGMLRCFDYAAVPGSRPTPLASARDWVASAQRAFLDGYAAESGERPARRTPRCSTAFQLDKAMYEVVYEARNRPTWLTIPTTRWSDCLTMRRKDLP